MKIKTLKEQKVPTEVSKITILTQDGSEIRISENKFGEIVINKFHIESCTIKIVPQSSNEVIIQ